MTGKSTKRYTAHIALICDTAYVIPTCTAVTSIFRSAGEDSFYDVIVVTAELSGEARELLCRCACERGTVRIVEGDMSGYKHLHEDIEGSVRVASPAALLKCDMPNLLPELDKVLYLDSDVIVRADLSELFAVDLNAGSHLLAAAADSGQIYYKHEYIDKVGRYFNSGVMLMNLALMRRENTPEKLIAEKRANPRSNLMDQNVFNVVMDGRVFYLEPIWNFLYVNLCNACQSYSIQQINELFGTDYSNLGDMERRAKIVHYASKDKPWKTPRAILSDEWYECYLSSVCAGMPLERDKAPGRPRFSVVVYMRDHAPYLEQCVASLNSQTVSDIEYIMVDNRSSDNSYYQAKKLVSEDSRARCLKIPGTVADAFNAGMRLSGGEKLVFMYGCEILPADGLERLLSEPAEAEADVTGCNMQLKVSDPLFAPEQDNSACFFYASRSGEDNCGTEHNEWPRVYRRSFLEKYHLFFEGEEFAGHGLVSACADHGAKIRSSESFSLTRLFAPSEAQPQASGGAIEQLLACCAQLRQLASEEHRSREKLEAGVRELDARYKEISDSTSYRVGRRLTAIPSRIKQALKNLLSK